MVGTRAGVLVLEEALLQPLAQACVCMCLLPCPALSHPPSTTRGKPVAIAATSFYNANYCMIHVDQQPSFREQAHLYTLINIQILMH